MRILEAFLEPAHPMAGMDWQGGSQHFLGTEKDMLPSRASRCTSRGTGQASPLLPSARDGCSGMKVGAHPGLPRLINPGQYERSFTEDGQHSGYTLLRSLQGCIFF